MQLIVPNQPTKDVLTKFFDDNRAKVKGKFVMVGAAAASARHDPHAAEAP